MSVVLPAHDEADDPADARKPPHGKAAAAPAATLGWHSLVLPIGIYLLLVAYVWIAARHDTGGRLVYAIDDSYIQMAIAKNVAAHGIFGITGRGFVSASSTIAMPLLTALAFKIFGTSVLVPLILQIAIGILLLGVVWEILRSFGIGSNLGAAAILSAFVLVVPMVPMTYVAMEHLPHVLVAVLFAAVAVGNLSSEAGLLPVLLCAAAASSLRYEGAFEAAAIALLYLLAKRIPSAVAVLAAGAAPIVLFGLYSISQGGFFLPNSLLLKRHGLNFETAYRLLTVARECPEIFVLVVAALLLLACSTGLPRRCALLLQIFLLTALGHQLLASYGWFYRYEAYLVGLGFVAVSLAAWSLREALFPRRGLAALALATLALPLLARGACSLFQTPTAMTTLYRQQYQMAQFFRTYYPKGRIALNDVGAVSFFTDGDITDLVGLADPRILRARIADHALSGEERVRYSLMRSSATQAALADANIEAAAIYDDWFGISEGNAPPGWILVERWSVPQQHNLGGTVVSFYGVGPENTARLRNNLLAYRSQLPAKVTERSAP